MIVKGVDSQRIGLSGEQDVRLEGMSEEWTKGMVKERKDARMLWCDGAKVRTCGDRDVEKWGCEGMEK